MKKYIAILSLALLILNSSCIEENENQKMKVPCYMTLNDKSYVAIFDHEIIEDRLYYRTESGAEISIEMEKVEKIQCGPYKPVPVRW